MKIKLFKLKNNVKQAREDKGMSREELADKIFASKQMIKSIERGNFNPSIKTALLIAEVLGRSVEELFGLEKRKHNG